MAGELGHKSMTIGMDITPFLNNEKQLESQLKRQDKLLKSQEQYSNLTGKSLNSLGGIYNSQKTQLSGYNNLLQSQTERYNKNLEAVKGVTKATPEQQRALAQSATAMENTKMKIANLTASMQKNQQQMATMNSGWTKFGTVLQTAGGKITSAGKNLTSFGKKASIISAPIIAGFAKATQSAVSFQSQISAIGPLLTNGGKITATVQRQLDSMSASSLKWSTQYGISTGDINDAMAELVKRGFTANQTMGSMGSILDATRASGEDMSDVMNVTASVIEQFGMKADTTSQQTKNTGKAVDSLTYIANATASDFKTMGDAMTYVGPIASQAGMSIDQTAAAIGLMANKGIDASTAGTSLRAALSRLMTPSKIVDGKMKALGVNVDAFRKGSIGLPEVIAQIEKGTKGMTKVQKAGAIASAFGKQAQGFAVLLGKDGAKNLETYTKAAQGSAGAVAAVAKQLNNTPQAKLDRLKQSFNVLGITIGQQVLPTLMPLVKRLTELVKGFGELPKPTQQAIIKGAAFAAILGPMALGLGKVTTGVGGLVTKIGKFASGQGIKAGMNAITSGSGSAIKSVMNLGGSITSVGATTATALPKVGLFSNAMANLPAIMGPVGLALGAGIAIWELWGKKAMESGERTQRWGVDVGETNDKALDKITGFQGNASLALEHFGSDTAANAKSVNESFGGMSKTISDFAKKSNDDIKSAYNTLDPYLQALAKTGKDKKIASNNAVVKQAKDTATAVINITKSAGKQRRDLTSSEHEFIVVSQKQENQNMVSLMGLSAKQQKMVLKNLNGDIGNLTRTQANTKIQSVKDSGKKIASYYSKQYKSIATMEKEGAISHGQANQMRDEADQKQGDAMQNLAATAYELQSRYGDLNEKNMETGRTGEEATLMFQSMGITLDQAREAYLKAGKSADTFKDSLVAVGNSKWDQNWNMDFLYDAKNGVMRTKDQLVDFVATATKSKDQWNNLKFTIQKAKISPEGLEAVAQGIEKAKAWNQVDLKTWTAMLEQKWGTGAKDTWDWWIQTGQVSQKDLQLALTGDFTGLAKVIDDADKWNSLSLSSKEMFVEDKASVPFIDALVKGEDWNKLPVPAKAAIVDGHQSMATLGALMIQLGDWNLLPSKEKKALLNSKEFIDKMATTDFTWESWNSKPDSVKQALLKDDGFNAKLDEIEKTSKNSMEKALVKKIKGDKTGFDLTQANVRKAIAKNDIVQPKKKIFNADNTQALTSMKDTDTQIKKLDKVIPKKKVMKGDSKSVVNTTGSATKSLGKYNKVFPGVKTMQGKDKASAAANAARKSVGKFGGNETITKRFNFVANIGNSLRSWWNKLGHNANGTSDWKGGLSWVGDGGRSEMVYQPKSGTLVKTPASDTLMNLDRHSIVWPSVNKFNKETGLNFPQYATGTANRAVETAKYIPSIVEKTSSTGVVNGSNEIRQILAQNTQMMNNILQALTAVASRPIVVESKFEADMRTIADGTTKFVQQNIDRNQKMTRRRVGNL